MSFGLSPIRATIARMSSIGAAATRLCGRPWVRRIPRIVVLTSGEAVGLGNPCTV